MYPSSQIMLEVFQDLHDEDGVAIRIIDDETDLLVLFSAFLIYVINIGKVRQLLLLGFSVILRMENTARPSERKIYARKEKGRLKAAMLFPTKK